MRGVDICAADDLLSSLKYLLWDFSGDHLLLVVDDLLLVDIGEEGVDGSVDCLNHLGFDLLEQFLWEEEFPDSEDLDDIGLMPVGV